MDTEVEEKPSVQDEPPAFIQHVLDLEQRIVKLEQAAHTEHTLSAETINQIVNAAVLQMHSHFQRLMGLGRSLLQEEKAQ